MFLYARSTTVSTRRLMVVDGRPGRRDSRSWRFVRRPLGLSGENRRRSIESMSRRTLLAATVPPRRPPSLSSPPLSSLSLSLFRARAPRLPRVLTVSLSRASDEDEKTERERKRERTVCARVMPPGHHPADRSRARGGTIAAEVRHPNEEIRDGDPPARISPSAISPVSPLRRRDSRIAEKATRRRFPHARASASP